MSAFPWTRLNEELSTIRRENAAILEKLESISDELSAVKGRLDADGGIATGDAMRELFLQQEHWLYDEMERHEVLSSNRDAANALRLRELLRGGEPHRNADLRLFANLTPATGPLRLYQKANTALMAHLDEILGHLGITYWFSCGTLIAQHYRHGPIPWDDDIDTYLLRADIERLREYLDDVSGDPSAVGYGYQVTVVYDRLASCRQVRFSSRGKLPCFIDLSVMDWTCGYSPERERRMFELRQAVIDDIAASEELSYWNEHPFLYAPGSGRCLQVMDDGYDDVDPEQAAGQIAVIESIFAKWEAVAREEGLVTDEDDAAGVAQSIDQVNTNHYLWDKEIIFPTTRAAYEQYVFSVPADAEAVCQGCYPGSPYLPGDIIGHDHFARELLSDAEMIAILEEFVANQPKPSLD